MGIKEKGGFSIMKFLNPLILMKTQLAMFKEDTV